MPSGEYMQSTLRSNDSIRLDKSRRFRKTLGGYGKKGKTQYSFPKATPTLLKEIRARIKKENRILWLKIIVLSVFIITVLVWMLLAS